MWVGIDDTDSVKGGCTTYLAALVCKKFHVKSLPKLVRLNPNIPYKTRGNGAVAVDVHENGSVVRDFVLDLVKKYAHTSETNTNPGIVFFDELGAGEKNLLREFYIQAVSRHVTIDEASTLAEEVSAEVHRLNNGRGVIGALAAVGCPLADRTYELIAYRSEKAHGPRKLNSDSVFEMNSRTYPKTYDNVDLETGQVLITPHGRDPLFCGIRGETRAAVEAAWSLLKPLEEIPLTQVFETNQGTDSHLRSKIIPDVRPFDCVILEGFVSENPKTIEGGHVLFRLSDSSGSLWCAAYEPTGSFRDVVKRLRVGDAVRCFGGVGRYPETVNLEKLFVSALSEDRRVVVPNCCGKKMTSAGKNKGFKCRKCGKKTTPSQLTTKKSERGIGVGWYEVPPRARRHLSKPLIRQI